VESSWFRTGVDPLDLQPKGFRAGGGGAHQAMTMMYRELSQLLTAGACDLESVRRLIVDENILGKSTAAAKASALRHLRNLYGLGAHSVVTGGLETLWGLDPESRPLLALLCALARDPLLRDSADAVLGAAVGSRVGAQVIAESLGGLHPGRFAAGMLGGISRNCASSWTQSGHLSGRVNKLRTRPAATPVAAAYAALLASLAGFGGPALIASPWMDVLDLSTNERLALLRRAEAQGLLRVRAAGDVVEVVLDPLLARIDARAQAANV
jgi:hypothetical protein